MQGYFNRLRISAKLPAITVAITLCALLGVGTLTTLEGRRAIEDQAVQRLAGLADSRAATVENWLRRVSSDISVKAQSPVVQDALLALSAARSGTGADSSVRMRRITGADTPAGAQSAQQAVTEAETSAARRSIHEYFVDLIGKRGYPDLFLFDPDGNVVYSAAKNEDFATSVLTGPYADSGLGAVFRQAVGRDADDAPAFADFEPYSAGGGEAAGFIARPVFNASSRLMGVIAFRLSMDPLNDVLLDPQGLGETGQAYMAGVDGVMRTKPRVNDLHLLSSGEMEAVNSAIAGERGVAEVANADGALALVVYQPISFLGAQWAFIAEETAAELYAPAARMQRQVIVQSALAALVVCIATLLLSRNITGPLGQVGDAMRRVAEGAFDVEVPGTERRDEIGTIANTLEAFRASLEKAEAASRVAAFKSAAFESSSSPLMMVDASQTISFVNASMIRLFRDHAADFNAKIPGFDPGAIVGRNVDIFRDEAGGHTSIIPDASRLPMSVTIGLGDSQLELRIAAIRDDAGEQLGCVLEWQDRTREIRNEAILDALDISQARVDIASSGRILAVNALMADLMGAEASALVGRNMRRMITATDLGDDFWDKVIEGEAMFGRFEIRSGDQTRILRGGINPVADRRGEIQGLVLLANDVTEADAAAEKAEQERREAIEAQTHAVQALGSALEKLSDGDMTGEIEVEFAPEYERLREDFNRAIGKLLAAMRAVVENADAITAEVRGITRAANDLSGRTENQAATLEETATALDQLTASVKSSADRAGRAAQIVDEARSSAEESGTVVREAVAAMSEIETSSQKIVKIIGVIDDIAFQTNLLALNAGVEAARAGDAGRGFAVVASEVRALAQRSSEAAREIDGLISASGAQVQRGVALVGDAGKALDKIVGSVTDIASHVGEMASSSSEQSLGLMEINQAMMQLDQVTQQNAIMFQETSAASEALQSAAETLAGTVARFRTDRRRKDAIPLRSASLGSSEGVYRHSVGIAPKQVVGLSVNGRMTSGVRARPTAMDDDWAEF